MKGKNVLLVNPWIHDFAAYDLWAKPLGLLSIGAVIRANGCRVSFIDCLRSLHPLMPGKAPRAGMFGKGKYYREVIARPEQISDIPRKYSRYGISEEAFMEDLRGMPEPDAILVTSLMTYWYPGVFSAIKLLRKAYPGTPVILGGIYASLCRDHAARFSGAHHVISGEGELSVLSTLTELWGKAPVYVPDMGDLDTLPYPLFDLVDPLKYVCIQTSRGCPYRCTYCASQLLYGGLRRRDPVRVADEISFWVREHGVSDFAFYDDALLQDAARYAEPLMREVLKRALQVRFHCPNALHARGVTRETSLLMKQCGFSTIRLGLETSDAARQLSSGGKVTNDEFFRAMENLSRAGFAPGDVGVYILCGLPGQEAGEVMAAVRFVKESGARPMIAEYSPLPGTGEWEKALSSSRYDLAMDPIFQNNTILPCAWEGLTLDMYREIRSEAQQR
jgi:radical SAM superfamily enzyme YgiQ (UPF0313 family)